MANFLEATEDAFLRWQFARSMRMQLAFLEDVLLLMADGIPLSDALTLIGQVRRGWSRALHATCCGAWTRATRCRMP